MFYLLVFPALKVIFLKFKTPFIYRLAIGFKQSYYGFIKCYLNIYSHH